MVAFDPEVYLKQEADEIAEQFLTLKKDDLKALGKHLKLVLVANMKVNIQKAILNHLTSENVLEERYVDRGLPLQSRIQLICYAYALRKKYQLHSKSNSSKGSDNSSSSYQSNDSDVEKQTSVSPSVDSKQNSSSTSSSSSPPVLCVVVCYL